MYHTIHTPRRGVARTRKERLNHGKAPITWPATLVYRQSLKGYRRARNQFHVFTLFDSFSNFILPDAIPFMVSLPLTHTLGSILVQY
jgi:hypothetical protein